MLVEHINQQKGIIYAKKDENNLIEFYIIILKTVDFASVSLLYSAASSLSATMFRLRTDCKSCDAIFILLFRDSKNIILSFL